MQTNSFTLGVRKVGRLGLVVGILSALRAFTAAEKMVSRIALFFMLLQFSMLDVDVHEINS